jgi:phosphoribosyl 1,2-cyclic phosphodiesterase
VPQDSPEQLPLALSGRPRAGIASLGSGSRGNGTLVSLADSLFLIDCGFTLKETIARLRRLGVDATDLTAVLVTHEHSDHVHGVARLARRYGVPVYATRGTLDAVVDWKGVDATVVERERPFRVGDVELLPVAVPHDAREPCQFVLEADGRRIGVLTDLGEITDGVRRRYAGCDALLVEANHDRTLLWNGRYPWPLKRRIASGLGHLANDDTLAFLEQAELARDCAVVVGHLSQENNARELLDALFAPLRDRLPRLVLASQDAGADWQSIG